MSATQGNSLAIGPVGAASSIPWRPHPTPYQPPYQPPPIQNPPIVTTQFVTTDYVLTKVRAICEMLASKAITRAEARKMLAKVDPAFALILGESS